MIGEPKEIRESPNLSSHFSVTLRNDIECFFVVQKKQQKLSKSAGDEKWSFLAAPFLNGMLFRLDPATKDRENDE